MRWAFVIYRYFPHGGLQKDFVRILREAAKRGHSVTVLCAQLDAPLPETGNVETKVFPVPGFGNHGKMKKFEKSVRKFLAEKDFDAVLLFNRMACGDFYFAADNCLAKWYGSRSFWPLLRFLPRYRTFLALENSVFSTASPTKIFTITPGQVEDYRAAYGTQPERFIPLPPGIDPDFRRPSDAGALHRDVCREFGFPETTLLLLQTAAKFRVKGVDRTLRALAALPAVWREKCRLLVAGGDDAAPARRFCRGLGIEKQVVFAGARSDIPRLVGASQLMVHPARNEATGTVIAEALATGVPVIASGACGFASYAAMIDEKLALPEPFRQEKLDETLVFALENLERLSRTTREKCSGFDFYRRAELAVDALESFAGVPASRRGR
ncbi:MAG: glycosyltransferase family 4 protein [Victivallaceae bacterium]|nr:glycosyltransferase family 4 protein [Victivallaceae bacterium]